MDGPVPLFAVVRDSLTGLDGRTEFLAALERALAADELALVLFDVDHLYWLNREFGRDVGAGLLSAVADALRRVDGDAFRLGGDEFALLVRGPITAAVAVADEVRADILELGYRTSRGPVSVKAGIASSESGITAEDLLIRADQVLSGTPARNRVTLYDPVVHRPKPATISVFVYGTLMPGEPRWPVLEPFVESWRPAIARGFLWDTGRGYPAAQFSLERSGVWTTIGSRGDEIPGVAVSVLVERSVAAIRRLDEVENEGALYRRVRIDASQGPAHSYEWIGATVGFTRLPNGWHAST